MAYSILLLHVLLLGGLGCLVLFFRGFIQYMIWVFLGGSVLIAYSGYRIYKRVKEQKKGLQEMLSLPMFSGRNVEIQLLGGLASVKVGAPGDNAMALDHAPDPAVLQLEDPASSRIRKLGELARLFENELITLDEYNRTKDQLLNGTTGP
ncbi:hypothetical protein [Desulfonema ishimotonii]|nr:hypothetical protein [Desulfonema ishimotonii]